MLWRQGDVFIETVKAIPEAARQTPLPHGVLVHGEITGHSHHIEDLRKAPLFAGATPAEVYIEVTSDIARIVHEEHGPIPLPQGLYRVWRQREYSPAAIRVVMD